MSNKRGKKRLWKKLLATVLTLAVVAGAGTGIWMHTKNSAKPVSVFSFRDIGMEEYWGDTQDCYGEITTDRIQTVYLTDTQEVTEIHVAEGDTVKKGDALISFDTTLSELEMERKRLEVEKLKIDLEDAQKELRRLKGMSPRKDPPATEPTEPDYGRKITDEYEILVDRRAVPYVERHDGSDETRAIICWLSENYYQRNGITYELVSEILDAVPGILAEIMPDWGEIVSDASAIPEETGDGSGETPVQEPDDSANPVDPVAPTDPVAPIDPVDPTGSTDPVDPVDPTVPSDPTEPTGVTTEPTEETTEPTEETTEPTEETTEPTEETTEPTEETTEPTEETTEPTEETTEPTEETTEPTEEDVSDELYIVLKVTENDQIKANRILWEGLHIFRDGRMAFFNAMATEDYSLPEEEEEETPVDTGGPYSYTELKKMQKEQEQKIKDAELKVKLAEADYNMMLREVNDGTVRSEIDGKVISLLSEEEAKNDKAPMIKVSGGGGFYFEGSVSELVKNSISVGQEVTIQDWENGGEYTGIIQEIMDYPSSRSSWNGIGNYNATSYPFTVFIDETANLKEGSFVNCTYSASSENGIYLSNEFLRTEGGKSYVYVRGAEDRLEKRYVATGKSLYGSYTEIKSGLAAEDYLAFPYGKTVKEGAPTVEGDLSDLYSY